MKARAAVDNTEILVKIAFDPSKAEDAKRAWDAIAQLFVAMLGHEGAQSAVAELQQKLAAKPGLSRRVSVSVKR